MVSGRKRMGHRDNVDHVVLIYGKVRKEPYVVFLGGDQRNALEKMFLKPCYIRTAKAVVVRVGQVLQDGVARLQMLQKRFRISDAGERCHQELRGCGALGIARWLVAKLAEEYRSVRVALNGLLIMRFGSGS